jgi:hypothetical protein
MWAGVADPADAVDGARRPEQLGEQGPPLREVAPVAVDVLTEERDLADTVAGGRGDLGEDVVEGTADLPASDRRDDAEGARVVAADLDRDPAGPRVLAAHG